MDGVTSRYTRFAVLLHWIVAAIVLVQYPLGWWMQTIAKQPPGPRAEMFNLHKSIGLAVLALMIARLAWRLGHAPPALPAMPRWQAILARATHWLFYLLLIGLPLTGYLGSVFSGYPVKFFGVTLPAWGAKSTGLKDAMSTAHLMLTWALLGVFGLHILAVVKHVVLERDGLMRRMGWSGPSPRPSPKGEGDSAPRPPAKKIAGAAPHLPRQAVTVAAPESSRRS